MPFLPIILTQSSYPVAPEALPKITQSAWRFFAFFGETPEFTGEQRWETAVRQREAR
jgi:hypothetical protein